MPRAPVAGREIRRRSRNGCWNCKARKVKCGEEKPRCSNCERLDEDCDYKIRLSWGGRPLKKKQLENGGTAGDPSADDGSQFIPGAGQFSLNQHFPAPQTFVSTNPPNGTARKPPVPRLGSGKKTSMSNYQTVFAVGETTMPPPPAPATQAPPAMPAPTKIKMEAPSPVPANVNLSIQVPPPPGPRQTSGAPSYGWPNSATSITSSATYDNGQQQDPRAFYSPYTPGNPPFTPTQQPTSPTGFHHSPPIKLGSQSPEIPFQALGSPRQAKNFHHPPPPIVTSPSKRVRTHTSTSPTQPPPSSPFIFERPMAPSLDDAIDYLNTPITSAPLNPLTQLALDHHPAVTGIGMGANTVMRRVSVENLLADPLDPTAYPYGSGFGPELDVYQPKDDSQYGTGNGTIDDDDDIIEIPRNEFAFGSNGLVTDLNNTRGFFKLNSAYRDQISIPRRLDPLPQLLLGNTKNMMYFHHYLHHTARLLVPHDCSENPFKHILPQMAVETDHLMNLLLAYSASHQARLLGNPEPTERIGEFIDETVRSLTVALNNPEDAASDASLATAIMLASYQIVSPNPFAASGLTWQMHLNAARKIVVSRGGAQGMHSDDTVSYFLVRWFAYLDLIGRLSGRDIDEPISSGKYWTNDNEDELAEYAVDCFFGFTTRCVAVLANIGELARKCELQRRAANGTLRRFSQDGEQNENTWTPPRDTIQKAMALRSELAESRSISVGRCGHDHDHSHSSHFHSDMHSTEDFDQDELLAANDAFHWAAEIHLFRRVLGYPADHPDVQEAVDLIVNALYKVRPKGTAENCLLFPMFTAGCEAINFDHREYLLTRMVDVEKTGLTQVKNARLLMQRVWNEGVAWWEIVNGEFIG